MRPVDTTSTTANISLEPIARDRESTLRNLLELYAHDFSEHVPLPIKASGRFEVALNEVWWTREDHFAYFIQLGAELAGFALVRAGSRVTDAPEVMDVAEFFVLRGVRARGVGRAAAHALFRAFSRPWEIRVRRTNGAALQFWSRVAHSWLGQPVPSRPFSVDGVGWNLLQIRA